MIKTNEFKFTPKELFWLSLRKSYRRFLLGLCVIVILTQIIDLFIVGWNVDTYFKYIGSFLGPVVIYPVFIVLALIIRYFNLRSSKNKMYFELRHYEIDDKFFKIVRPNGGEASYAWSDILKVLKSKDRYCLMVTKVTAIHLPFNIFKSKKDENTFKKLLVDKNLI